MGVSDPNVGPLDTQVIHVLHNKGLRFFFIMLQNSGNEKLCIISVIFHEMFLDCGWALVAETLDRKTTDEGLLVHPRVRRR